jgi:heme oxygenase
MSNRTPRNIMLLQQISDSNPFKKAVAGAFDIAADLERDMESVRLNRDLSPEGRQKAAQGHLRSALRDLRDLKKPVEDFHSKTEELSMLTTTRAFGASLVSPSSMMT